MKQKLAVANVIMGLSLIGVSGSVIAANDKQYTMTDESTTMNPQDVPYQNNDHLYIGLRTGWGAFDGACSDNAEDCNDDTLGYGLYGGYQFAPWFALEGGVTDYGKPDAKYTSGDISADIYGVEASGLFMYRLNDKWTPYLRLGAAYQNIKKDIELEDDDKKKDHDWHLLTAAGLDYKLSRQWSIRGEYQFINGIGGNNTGNADLHFTSLGLTYHFNQPEPIRYTQKEITLDSNALFAFGDSKLKSFSDLDSTLESLKKYGTGNIKITGYTDSIGQEEFNKKLSLERARSVYNYMINNGLKGFNVYVVGKGELEPIADNSTEKGREKNRRVTIEFNTTVQEEVK
ncbi:OmpA family protein [Vibrio gangliei]|uniref:OmpA family protein n=1 Tax=Vibrio gangliei TaxID=2077090 RepID=UPI000D012022|nr:OmpA family protein [Vibrio gangliei]